MKVHRKFWRERKSLYICTPGATKYSEEREGSEEGIEREELARDLRSSFFQNDRDCVFLQAIQRVEEVIRSLGENNGLMAEWLGKGLQNLVQRFESASDLTGTALQIAATRFSFCFVIHLSYNN